MQEETIIDIIVIPRSSKRRAMIDGNNNIRVYLNSPPVDGKANEECISILSKKLKVARSQISIIRGERGRKKSISVKGISRDKILDALKS